MEEYATEALELINARRENFVVYGKGLLSKGEHPDRIREEIEDDLKSDMEKVLFEHLKSRGVVCGDIDQLYDKYGFCRRFRLKSDKCGASLNLLNIREVLPNFGDVVGSIMVDANKLRIIDEMEAIIREAKRIKDVA